MSPIVTERKLYKSYTIKDLDNELSRSAIENLALEPSLSKSYRLDIKRDDLIHPIISGNKWRKLKYLLQDIENSGFQRVAAMGGRYSNFLHALSYVCYLLGWDCELYVRGYQNQTLTQTLIDCKTWGATIHFVDRQAFRALRNSQPNLADDTYWISEGGQQVESTLGIAEIVKELPRSYDYIVIASATGTSVAGLANGYHDLPASHSAYNAKNQTHIIGVCVLNNQQQQIEDVNKLVNTESQFWQIKSGYEFGGFAKKNQMIDNFCDWFSSEYQIQIEPIYTGRSFYAVFDLMKKGFFKKDSNILLVHCGGLQGARNLEQ